MNKLKLSYIIVNKIYFIFKMSRKDKFTNVLNDY